MKRILIVSIFVMAAFAVSAQNVNGSATTSSSTSATTVSPTPQPTQQPTTQSVTAATATAPVVEQVVSQPKTDWLMPFNSVKIDGPMNVVFKKVATADEMRIIHDTKGNITAKFKFEVDKKGTLVVSEKSDPKRTSVTDITIYYTSLRDVKIAHAKSVFEDVVDAKLLDLTVSGGAIVSIGVNSLDLAVECTGSSRLTIEGSTKYLTMRASTAKINCSNLSTVSTTVDASHSAEVRIIVSERLEATTSTSAKLLYKGHPTILREHNVIFGGDIININ